MATKKTSDSFHSSLAKLSTGKFSSVKRQSISQGFKQSTGLNFGAPSAKALFPTQTTGGFDWTGLAKSLGSGGGAASLFTGGGGLAGGGVGSLIAGIANLFGGGSKALPALKLFQLPDAVNQTVHLQNPSSGTSASPAVHVHVQALDSQSFLTKSNDIAKAVKTAMLNSHSLNDVVSEL